MRGGVRQVESDRGGVYEGGEDQSIRWVKESGFVRWFCSQCTLRRTPSMADEIAIIGFVAWNGAIVKILSRITRATITGSYVNNSTKRNARGVH